MDNPFKSPVILSLCTGMRGLERGIERVFINADTVAYVEIEAFAAYNLVAKMEQGLLAPRPIWTDVKTFGEFGKMLRGKVDFVTGGYPCQPFSHVGRMRGIEDPRHLWPYIGSGNESIVGTIRPLGCFFENVSNHINIGYEQVKRDLEELDYSVEEGIFSAQEVGAPHIRKRLFILALDNSMLRRYRGSKEKIFSRWITTELSGKTLDNAIGSGLERHTRHEGRENGRQRQAGSATTSSFPLGQGVEQFEWEAPRVESSVGYAINGYNFREDLLRMAGNAVVEQTAELAFRTLLSKFGLT